MPELPDVECFRQHLHATSLHRDITLLRVFDPSLVRGLSAQEFEQFLIGRTMTETARYGTYLFVNLDGWQWIVMHFGMAGSLLSFQDPDKRPRHTKVLFSFPNGHHLAYINGKTIGGLHLISSPIEFIHARSLGIDALDSKLDFPLFQQILSRKKGMIKSILIDQHCIAGIGSIYSDEILFQSGIHPAATARSLSVNKLKALFFSIHDVLVTAIESRAEASLLPVSYMIPVRAQGAACPKCGDRFLNKRISGRTAIFCPVCQPEDQQGTYSDA